MSHLLERRFEESVLTTTVDHVFNWARKSAIWPMTFGLACCAIEMMASGGRASISRASAPKSSARRPASWPRGVSFDGTVKESWIPDAISWPACCAAAEYQISQGNRRSRTYQVLGWYARQQEIAPGRMDRTRQSRAPPLFWNILSYD
jgi:hypothetical protein